MRSLATIFLTAAGGGIGYLISDDALGLCAGAAAGIAVDMALQYAIIKTIENHYSEPKAPK